MPAGRTWATASTCTDVSSADPVGLTLVVGGVGELFQGDLDLGRRLVDRLAARPPRPGLVVEDFCYGAIAVTARLAELQPDALLLAGAKERGREPGTVHRRLVGDLRLSPDQVQVAIGDAGTGYVDLDLAVEVAWGLEALPARTVVVEVEPARTGPGDGLSDLAAAALDRVVDLVDREHELLALHDLVARLRPLVMGDRLEPSPALDAVRALLAELEHHDREGRWGRTFAEKDRLQLAIGEGATSEGMDHLDWGLWWALIEEVERVERATVAWDA